MFSSSKIQDRILSDIKKAPKYDTSYFSNLSKQISIPDSDDYEDILVKCNTLSFPKKLTLFSSKFKWGNTRILDCSHAVSVSANLDYISKENRLLQPVLDLMEMPVATSLRVKQVFAPDTSDIDTFGNQTSLTLLLISQILTHHY